MVFQKNIAGLRGIAILAVLIYHFFPLWLPSGYLGVDVFFVISGYLMTRIIASRILERQFYLFQFYISRAKRLIPSLTILVLSLLIFGWFSLIAIDYKSLALHSMSGLLLMSNLTHLNDIGYFAPRAIEKWLLHTWSLSIEWQFYILYPLTLLFLYRVMLAQTVKLVMVLVLLISFYIWFYASIVNPNYAFYTLSARMWEMLLGAMIYFFPLNKFKNKPLLEVILILLLIICFIYTSSMMSYCLINQALCLILTFLIIQCQQFNSKLLSNEILQKIGGWSYSIYLWHWPLKVFLHYYSYPFYWNFLGIFISIILGAMNYILIEKLYYKNKNRACGIWRGFVVLYVLTLLLSLFILSTEGAQDRYTPVDFESKLVTPTREQVYCFYTASKDQLFNHDSLDKKNNLFFKRVKCFLGDKSNHVNTLLFGDSYAGHYEPFLDYIFKKNKMAFQSLSASYCRPTSSKWYKGQKYTDYLQCMYNRTYVKNNLSRYRNIFFAGSWGVMQKIGGLKDTKNFMLEVANQGINVFILPAPKYQEENQVFYFYRKIYLKDNVLLNNRVDEDKYAEQSNNELENFANSNKNIFFIKRSSIFSKKDFFEYNGYKIPYQMNSGHLSILSSIEVAKNFMKTNSYQMMKLELFKNDK